MTRALAIAMVAVVALAGAPAEAKRTYRVQRDLSYRPGGAQHELDLYRPRGLPPGARRPVVVWIHGGGWRKGDKRVGVRRKAELFTGAGYVFASINYRLSPVVFDPRDPDPDRVMFPAQPTDVGEALDWLRANVAWSRGDPARMLLIGHSAGAHLASLVATDPGFGVRRAWLLGFVSLDSPVFDIAAAADPAAERHRESREMLWNAFGTPAENALSGAWTRGSPLRWADPGDPPGLLVTQAANRERVDEANAMATALGDRSERRVVPVDLDHREISRALGRGDPSGETRAVMAFMREQVRTARAAREGA